MSEGNDSKPKSKFGRLIIHALWNIAAFILLYIFQNKIKSNDLSIFAAFLLIAFYTLYFGTYLLERMAITENHKRSHFYLIRKILSVLLNISYCYGIVYFIIYTHDTNAVTDNSSIGNTFIEKLGSFFYYSFGNFLGYDSTFLPKSLLFKLVQVLQSLTGFIVLVYLFTNFDTIKKEYSGYYKEND